MIDITSDHLVVDTRAKEANQAFGATLIDLIHRQWDHMSRKVKVHDDTKERRRQAMRDGKSGWYTRRYGGGKRHTPPLESNINFYGTDSGKLRNGFKIRFQQSSSRNRSVGRINVPARRFDRFSFGRGYDQWVATVQKEVSILAGDLDKAEVHPRTRGVLERMMADLAKPTVAKTDAQLARLIQRRNRALLRLLREVLKVAA